MTAELQYELPWSGEPLAPGYVGFDCETTVEDLRRDVPRFVLATATDGTRHVVIRPLQLADFIHAHAGHHWVLQNGAFDFHVLLKELARLREVIPILDGTTRAAEEECWALVDNKLFHDTLLMDGLLRIATGEGDFKGQDNEVYALNLARLADKYGGVPVSKEDEHRKRFGELLHVKDWSPPEYAGFFRYAVTDSIATRQIYLNQMKLVEDYLARYLPAPDARGRGPVYPDAVATWGPLTENVQVKASIALARVGRNGLGFSREKAEALERKYQSDYATFVPFLEQHYPDLLQRWKKKAGYKVTKKAGTPSINHKALVKVLEDVARRLEIDTPQSKGKTGGTSKSVKDWAPHAGGDEFLRRWTDAALLTKRLGFFASLRANWDHGRVHSKYNCLVRSGRTSNSSPNCQQWPRSPEFRSVFEPTPGYLLMAVDYKCIELRTLAAICEARFGKSALADTIRAGRDPHCHTAAMVSGEAYEEVIRWTSLGKDDPLRSDPRAKKHAKNRQSSKVVNFGLGGGLGPDKLAAYAQSQYGVAMTVKEATHLREKISREVYPELNPRTGYLASTDLWDLARGLGLPPDDVKREVYRELGDLQMGFYCLGRVLEDLPFKADGAEYSQPFQDKLWRVASSLAALSPALAPDFREQVESRKGSRDLKRAFFERIAWTLTGRPRKGVTYTAAANTPFQGLAADGMKLALWELTKRGYRCVGAVHDEIIVELPEATAAANALEVTTVMNESMAHVLRTVPSETDHYLGTCWSKP